MVSEGPRRKVADPTRSSVKIRTDTTPGALSPGKEGFGHTCCLLTHLTSVSQVPCGRREVRRK